MEATATVDDSVDPGRRLHFDHERPSGAELGARRPAKLESFQEHPFSQCYAAPALGAVIACRFSCRNAPTQHLLVSHGLPGLIADGRSRAVVGALYRLRKELSYTDDLGEAECRSRAGASAIAGPALARALLPVATGGH